jgi:malonyl-CoA O-methyltransferase
MSASRLAKHVDIARVATAFKRGLSTYHMEAKVQRQIAAQLAAMIDDILDAKSGLNGFEFGCGTGHLTEQLVAQLDFQSFIVNDLVADCAPMVETIAPSARFAAGEVDDVVLPQALDLITSSSVIQWLPNLSASLDRLSAHLAPNAILALSGFGTQHFKELRALRPAQEQMNYVDAEDWRDLLPHDLDLVAIKEDEITVYFQDFTSLLAHLRDTGVNGVAGSRLTKSQLAEMAERYEKEFGDEAGLPLTYHPVWVVARKKP